MTLDDVPDPEASWAEIERFAVRFDGYRELGADRCADLANLHLERGTVPDDLRELRACLFFEQRRWRHLDSDPDEQALRHLRALVRAIRDRLVSGSGR